MYADALYANGITPDLEYSREKAMAELMIMKLFDHEIGKYALARI
ncbi:hypothetical protein [Acetobacterium tundrae]|nr:hypothetical protein [Acetobacterium tundrae]